MPKAILVSDYEDNYDYIIEYAAARQFDLSDLRNNVECNAEDGFRTIVVTDGTPRRNNVTFTVMTNVDFHSRWMFANVHDFNTRFVEIIKKPIGL